MAQEDDLRALGKIMDFLRAVSIILAIMNVYWYCYEAMRMWGVTIGVVDRILINFNRTGGLFHSILYTKLFSLLLLALSCLGTKGVKAEKMSWNRIWTVLAVGFFLFFLNWWIAGNGLAPVDDDDEECIHQCRGDGEQHTDGVDGL